MEGFTPGKAVDGEGAERQLLRFDDFCVDRKSRTLCRGDDEPVPITPKVFAVLLALMRKPGEVVSKEELIETVWSGSFVTEANLTQSVSALRKALGERANDHRYIVTVPGQGYCFTARISDEPTQPAAPAASAPLIPPDEPAAVDVSQAEAPVPAPSWRPSRHAALVAVVIVLGLAGALILSTVSRESFSVPPEATVPVHRPAVAVLSFTNLSGRPESRWLATALPELLSTELAGVPGLRVISGEAVANAHLSVESDTLDKATLRRLHDVLGANLLVSGSYLALAGEDGKRLRLDLRVLQAPGGETRASLAEVGSESELFDLVARAGARLREDLGFAGPTVQEAKSNRALLPASPEAAKLYTQGLALLRSFDPAGALTLLQQAALADPTSAVIRSALAHAWAELGNDARALEAAREAVELARSLPREERLAIQARYHEVRKEWREASEIYRSLWTFYPDDLEHGLHLAAGLSQAGRNGEALATIAALRRLPPPEGEDPRIDLQEAQSAKLLADLKTEKRAAEAAAEKGRRSSQNLIVAQALLLQGEILMRTGEPGRAMQLYGEARTLFENAGHRLGVVKALTYLGSGLHEQGDLAGAEKKHEEALALAQELGSQAGVALQLANLGLIQQKRGDVKQALESLKQARSLHGQLGDRVFEARDLNALGTVLWTQGKPAAARDAFEKVLEISRATGNRRDEARALNNLGTTLAHLDRLEEALANHDRAVAILRDIGDLRLAASALADSAGVLVRLGALPEARRRLDEALAIKRRVQDRIGAAEVLDPIAGLDSVQGDLAASGRIVEQQLRSARELGVRTLALKGLRRKAGLQHAAGDLPAARRSLEEALRESARRGEELEVAGLKLDLASLALSEHRFDEAAGLAREAAGWYGSKGLPGNGGQAWALAAEAALRQDRPDEAREAASRARTLVERSGDRELLLAVAPRLARVDAASGEVKQAAQDLSRAAGEAGKLGFVTAGLEARFALGEIQGDRKILEDVRREAEARGFRRLAGEAARALEGLAVAGG